jgi:1,2-diacylglycerol 3-alpha-glucosyltransferase
MKSSFLSILNVGLDRDLLSPKAGNESQVRQIFYTRGLPARLVHLVKAPKEAEVTRIHLDKDLIVIPCPVRHWMHFLPKALRIGIEILRHEHIDLIQVQEPFISGLVGVLLAKIFCLPLVVGLYSDEIDNPVWLAERPLNHLANLIGKFVLRQASVVRTDSLSVADRLAIYGYQNLTHIPFLITHSEKLFLTDPNAEEMRQRLLSGSTGPLLLAVCRLEQEKNVSLMLEAFATAVAKYEGLVLAIAGNGSLKNKLKDQACRIAPGRVRWLGWIDNNDIPRLYQAADLMLLSSNRESAARVLYESLLAGTPVLSTDTAGAREVIDDGLTGRIVPVGDLVAYTQALIQLCGDPGVLADMGKSGRLRMTSRVTSESILCQMRDLYEIAMRQGK